LIQMIRKLLAAGTIVSSLLGERVKVRGNKIHI